MILFFSAGSPYARIIRILARERGPRLEEQEVPLRDPTSPLLPLHPAGRVPALLDGDALIAETLLILAHLGWLSADVAGRSRLGRALSLLDGIAVWNREMRRPEELRSPAVLALEETRAARILDALDPAEFDPASAEGTALLCTLGYGERRHRVWRWREGRGRLAAWFDDAARRPAFSETLPPISGI
ncbi:glutathione S-transferase family protein [Sabulicella rubraurantiaca]|uniref:glutathione S-transferase family protein n=1 Tax=Sabulicella rubraurantiaca TaxID=2811429 RepID=UPI001A9754BA|nr:glutathione S-transferase [Sabulicella rubraurantiaca]